ncbi:MAG: hypothetical protein EA406_01330 [Rhodospirillales bacterium]|nr:MAG: hypothetical protein EA406_01330 [Rhodospirillales bacterium]
MTTRSKTPTPEDARRIGDLSAHAADLARIGTLDLSARIEQAMSEEAALEAARLRYKYAGRPGIDTDPGATALRLGESYARRAQSLATDAKVTDARLKEAVKRDRVDPERPEVAPFTVRIIVMKGRQPVPEIAVGLLVGKTLVSRGRTDDRGTAILEYQVPRRAEGGPARRERAAAAPPSRKDVSREAARDELGEQVALTAVVLDDNGEVIAGAPVDAEIKPGGSTTVRLELG